MAKQFDVTAEAQDAIDALFATINNDDREQVKALLKADGSLATSQTGVAKLFDAKIFHWIYVGDTPLHLAAAGYRVEIVRILLSVGANANAAANMRRSNPLHYAADGCITVPEWDEKRQVKTIETLLAAGTEIHAQDANGATALHRAVRTRSAGAVECLLKSGANPKLKNKPGSTAFHLAVQNTGRGGSGADEAIAAQRRIIETFLAAGVSTQLTDGSGKTVLDCARSGWIRDMLEAR